jgi:hypothetical protein
MWGEGVSWEVGYGAEQGMGRMECGLRRTERAGEADENTGGGERRLRRVGWEWDAGVGQTWDAKMRRNVVRANSYCLASLNVSLHIRRSSVGFLERAESSSRSAIVEDVFPGNTSFSLFFFL